MEKLEKDRGWEIINRYMRGDEKRTVR